MTNTIKVSRRDFLKTSSLVGGGLIVGVSLHGCGGSGPPLPVERTGNDFLPNAFLQITEQNDIRFFCPRDEMGQGVTTGLATLIGEELDIDPLKVQVQLAGVHPDYANPLFGVQATGGSTSMKAHYLPLRQAAANTRQALIEAASLDLGVPTSHLSMSDGYIRTDDQSYPCGRFVVRAANRPLPKEAPLKPADSFRYIGRDIKQRLDAVEKSTGVAVYGIDVEVPGMHYAVVKRPPVAGSSVRSVDSSEASRMPGVTDILESETGVTLVAKKYWQARQALEKLKVTWNAPELSKVSTRQLKADYQRALDEEDGITDVLSGDPAEAFATADRVMEQQFWAPFLAHAPMEPMNALVRIQGKQAEVWSGTQSPQAVQGLVARCSGLSKENIKVHGTYLGGGFGRRVELAQVVEATKAAMATGKPVKVIWSREDDIRNGFYRPASLIKIKAGISRDGQIMAWQAKRVGANIAPYSYTSAMLGILPASIPEFAINMARVGFDFTFNNLKIDHSSVEGLYEDYDAPHQQVVHVTRDHGVPLAFWRSVGHSFTAFAKEVFVDELARNGGIDPIDFRLRNTSGNPRLNRVIRRAGEQMRSMKPEQGRGLGLAAHASFGSYVAQVAEVSLNEGRIQVHKVLCVIDCGLAVNPDIVRAQMEGGIMFGLTAALHGNLDLENGVIQQSNFHDYPILKMNESPAVEVVILDSKENPTGVGEPAVPPIAPAVANAVFALTGQRLQSLPLKPV